MQSFKSVIQRKSPVRSVATSEFPSPARISEPNKTLLVVDDDHEVREMEAVVLSQEGYNVLQAENAAEALRLAASTTAIHLLVTDYSMPEVDGLELARRFRAVHPKTPVLMVSGSLPLLRGGDEGLDRFEFLAKPFHLTELLRKVRTLLDTVAPLPRRKPWCCD
jgi:DNA-binding response OmpR family regulator